MNLHGLNVVKVRLSDSAMLSGGVSLLYALVLSLYPRAFPKLLERSFDSGHFFSVLALLLLSANELLFVLISRRRSQSPGLLTPAFIACLTLGVVSFFQVLVYGAHAQAMLSQFMLHDSNRLRLGISSEDLLIYAHFAMVSGIAVPYLVVRATQNYLSDPKPEKTCTAVAGP